MKTLKQLATTLLVSAAMIAGSAVAAHASQSPEFDAAEDQVTLDAIATSDYPIRDSTANIGYVDLSYMYEGDLVTVSPPLGENVELNGGYLAIRGEDGAEGVMMPDFVTLLPEGAQTFKSKVEIVEAEATGGFIGGIGTVDVHGIKAAPSNTSATIRDAMPGETFTAANDQVIGPGRMFTMVGYRPVKLEDGQTGYILAQVAQPVDESDTSAGKDVTGDAEPVIPPDMTETLHLARGVALYTTPDLEAPSRENAADTEVEGTQSFSADGDRWHQVDVDGNEFFVKDSDARPAVAVAATPEPEETAGVKDKLNDWWNGSEEEPAPQEEGEAGFWAGLKGKATGAGDTASTIASLPSLILSGVLALLSLLAATRSGRRMTGQICGGIAAAAATASAIFAPAAAPSWAAIALLVVAVVSAVTAFVSTSAGRFGRVNRTTISLIAGASAAAFITATVTGRPVYAAGALAIITLGAAAGIAPRFTGGRDMISSGPGAAAHEAPAQPDMVQPANQWRLDPDEETDVETTSEFEPIREPVLAATGTPTGGRIKLTLDNDQEA